MKALAIIIIIFVSILTVNAQDYLINFSGTGSSTTVETITVENLTQGKSITFSGSKTLHLMSTVTGNSPLLEYLDYPMVVYPNPSSGDFTIQFEAQKSETATVAIYDMSGREINKLQQKIQNGFQSFKVAGLSNGVYTIQVLMEDNKFTQKVVCNSKSTLSPSISYNGFSEAKQKDAALKNATIEQAWQYNTGDRLKFQGTSGKYSTIVMDIPTQSKTLSFDFVECTDADGNNYPVVKIGNQLWMAENLKTTKYNDGTPIPNETDNLKWSNLTEGAYCWYNNDIKNKDTYGALYNWYAVGTNKLAPRGWHVANFEPDWGDLVRFLGGQNVAGGKLKGSGNKFWTEPNTDATNETGFTAFPSGFRNVSAQDPTFLNFSGIGLVINYWTSSEFDLDNSLRRTLGFNNSGAWDGYEKKTMGYSVRCILGSKPFPNTTSISKITYASAESGGIILHDGGQHISSAGMCWSKSPHPTISDNVSIGSLSEGKFKSILSNLSFGTKYYVRAYAINSYGVGYGDELSFETPDIPTSISSITVKFAKDSIQMGYKGFAKCFTLDQNGDTIPNIPVKWTTSRAKIADINNDGVITTEYDGEVYIKAVYKNFVDSAKLVVTPDFNNWKAFFEPVPNAFPDLNSYYKETFGNSGITEPVRVDLNLDGRTDLVVHLWHFRTQEDNLTMALDAPVPNRLVALVAQKDGTFKDQTSQLFGTSQVDLAGGASSMVRVGDLNKDGYPDWVYALHREDNRHFNNNNMSNLSAAVLSNGDGTYRPVIFGENRGHFNVEILPMYDGSTHILFDLDEEYLFSNDAFIKINASPERHVGTCFAFSNSPNDPPDNLLMSKIFTAWPDPNGLALYKRNRNQPWSLEATFVWQEFKRIKFVAFWGDTVPNNIITYQGNEYIAGGFTGGCKLRLYPNDSPTPIANFTSAKLIGGSQGRTIIDSKEVIPWSRLMALETVNGMLQEVNIISEPEGSFAFNVMETKDINKDGYDDLITYPFVKGAKPRLYLNTRAGKLLLLNQNKLPDSNVDKRYNSIFVDADGDSIEDLIFFPGDGCSSDNSCTTFLLYKGRRQLQ